MKKKPHRDQQYENNMNNMYPPSYPVYPYPYQPVYNYPYPPPSHLYYPPPYPPPIYEEQPLQELKLTLSDKLSILEQLKYGDDWPEIKKRILEFEYNYDGYEETTKEQKNDEQKQENLKEKDKNFQSKNEPIYGPPNYPYNIPPYIHPDSPHIPPEIPKKNSLPNSEKQPARPKKQINYRLQVKGNKKSITQERIRQKYEQLKNDKAENLKLLQNNIKIMIKSLRQHKKIPHSKRNHDLVRDYSDDESNNLRYFDKCPEACRKCMQGNHETEYCPQKYLCMFCLSNFHESKVCPLKNVCTMCFKTGHKTDKCPQKQVRLQVCDNCGRRHIDRDQSSSNICHFLTKGQQNKQTNIAGIQNWDQTRCIRCFQYGHITCHQY